MNFELDGDEVVQSLTEACPRSPDGLQWDHQLNDYPKATCFIYKPCGKCIDGRVLNDAGRDLNKLLILDGGFTFFRRMEE